MMQENQSGQPSDDPAEGRSDDPPPKQDSPEEWKGGEKGSDDESGSVNEKDDVNPLAPPVNTGAAS